ncbi:DUF817 domain-containing protein [Microvirga puerhi]|uniref:DUF817 domain-containing protein n=1 Tax=Microvirga puerhi TaxID=2876078 RepID=A0ABS7VLG7_9HYPH|nr:DUF817 domain-containing protein [Microvirga puerhi]MBZ6076334.1 DUF817 domain-containing protein [Microvirga puerhi]
MLLRRPVPQIPSAAFAWPFLARFIAREEALGQAAERRGPIAAGLYEFLRFGIKEGWACLFGGAMCALLLGTHFFYPADAALARYDFLFLAALAIQALLIGLKLESLDEAKTIFIFHVVGTAMEVFKTQVGSWIYPEPSLFRLGGVPLFTGFMYASVGSYGARAWRLFDFRFTNHPPFAATLLLSLGIYINFFSHHYAADMRYVLFLAAAALYGRTILHFKVWRTYRRMPLLLGLFLVTIFIWFAENIGTFTGTWLYPSQLKGWSMVPLSKLGSWFLLTIISFVLVSAVNRPREMSGSDIGRT